MAFPLGPAILAAGVAVVAAAGDRLGGWLAYVTGVALLGLIDDWAGAHGPRGLRGHATALVSGRPSTGAIKGLGTMALAAIVASGSGLGYLVETGLLALAPHVGNLLDLRPGRVEKAATLALCALCAAAWTFSPLALVWPFALPIAAGACLTLRERAMLGDSGASLIGALVGVCLAATCGPAACVLALTVMIAISLYGEFRSISLLVDRVPLLQRLDSLGRAN